MQLERRPTLASHLLRDLEACVRRETARKVDSSTFGDFEDDLDLNEAPPTIHTVLPACLHRPDAYNSDCSFIPEAPYIPAAKKCTVVEGVTGKRDGWHRSVNGVSFKLLTTDQRPSNKSSGCLSNEPGDDQEDGEEENGEGSNPVLRCLRELHLVEGTPLFGLMFSEDTGGPLFTLLQLVRAFSNEFTVTCMQLLQLLRILPPIVVGGAEGRPQAMSCEASREQSEPVDQRDEADADVAARPVVIGTPEWVLRLGPEATSEWQAWLPPMLLCK